MNKYIGLSLMVVIGAVTASCDDWLDKMPDNRMELRTPEDISDLLVSAYSETNPAYLLEMYSDNADQCDNTGWGEANRFQRQAFFWDDITETSESESPQNLWNGYYTAIASCNASIEYIDGLSAAEKEEYKAQLGEALLCRAYNMFVLSTIFCNAFDPSTADNELGLPYPSRTETVVGVTYERGTLAELYQRIENDLLRGLPLVSNSYGQPKFHFTPDAAKAFATRFYLYSQQYDKALQYANEVLGTNPSAKLRDWDAYGALDANGNVQCEAFLSSKERSNLLLQVVYSEWGAIGGPYMYGDKYAHGKRISSDETMQSMGPWGKSSMFKYTVWYNNSLSKYCFRKPIYSFVYSDAEAGIGSAYCEYSVFNTDMLLLERAEAYALSGNLEAAVQDINTELKAFHQNPAHLTVESIKNFYNSIEYYTPWAATPKKHLHPRFTIDREGSEQEAVLQCILHLRRILTLHDGIRMQDIKRYGIVIYRRVMNSNYDIVKVTDSLTVDDPRRAIQIPQDVISAGLTGNIRTTNNNQSENIFPYSGSSEPKVNN